MVEELKSLGQKISLRPVVLPDEEDFLVALYYTTRDDIHATPLDEEQKKTLSLMQYLAQKQHYEKYFPGSRHDLILVDGERIGRLWTARLPNEIICVDISILPEFRNRKTGTFLLAELMDEAARTNRDFNLHVRKMNEDAQRLYKRLNFKFIGETPTHHKMQWRAANDLLGRTKE